MKRTWRQREAPNGVVLSQLTSFFQALQLGHPSASQVREQDCSCSLCSGGNRGVPRLGRGEQVWGCIEGGAQWAGRPLLSSTELFPERGALFSRVFSAGDTELSGRRRALLPTTRRAGDKAGFSPWCTLLGGLFWKARGLSPFPCTVRTGGEGDETGTQELTDDKHGSFEKRPNWTLHLSRDQLPPSQGGI